jgi:hypothetical protein
MRKRIIPTRQAEAPDHGPWLDLDAIAEVEITSEDPEHPIESALLTGQEAGWRASAAGQQVLRLLFDPPQKITHIQPQFEEPSASRTQEYVLRWSPERGQPAREIVRQQWNFSPSGATVEIEDYQVDLPSVAMLELIIDPDLEHKMAKASLASMRIA